MLKAYLGVDVVAPKGMPRRAVGRIPDSDQYREMASIFGRSDALSSQDIPISAARRVGSLLFVSGQLAIQDGILRQSDITTQTDIAIDSLESILCGHGLDLTSIIRIGVWLTSADYFNAVNNVYAGRFRAPYPARVTVISALAIKGALVEIDAIASFER